jgi:hypothetical protein
VSEHDCQPWETEPTDKHAPAVLSAVTESVVGVLCELQQPTTGRVRQSQWSGVSRARESFAIVVRTPERTFLKARWLEGPRGPLDGCRLIGVKRTCDGQGALCCCKHVAPCPSILSGSPAGRGEGNPQLSQGNVSSVFVAAAQFLQRSSCRASGGCSHVRLFAKRLHLR